MKELDINYSMPFIINAIIRDEAKGIDESTITAKIKTEIDIQGKAASSNLLITTMISATFFYYYAGHTNWPFHEIVAYLFAISIFALFYEWSIFAKARYNLSHLSRILVEFEIRNRQGYNNPFSPSYLNGND